MQFATFLQKKASMHENLLMKKWLEINGHFWLIIHDH